MMFTVKCALEMKDEKRPKSVEHYNDNDNDNDAILGKNLIAFVMYIDL